MQEYWTESGNRLRDSAKWMATVVGAVLATLAGTSPLTLIRRHHFGAGAVAVGLVGLLFLGIMLFLIFQVMRPQAERLPMSSMRKHSEGRFRQRWVSAGDCGVTPHLYLPCGVWCLTSPRQSMIIEKMTLMALAGAQERTLGKEMREQLEEAQAARAVRLVELRSAAAHITTIGGVLRAQGRSTWTTYGGSSAA